MQSQIRGGRVGGGGTVFLHLFFGRLHLCVDYAPFCIYWPNYTIAFTTVCDKRHSGSDWFDWIIHWDGASVGPPPRVLRVRRRALNTSTQVRVKNRFVTLAGLSLLLRHGYSCHVRRQPR